MLQLWRQRPGLVTAFFLACAATLFFAGRFTYSAIYWSNPEHRNQKVEAWMTVGYISKSWHLEGPRIDALAGLPGPKEKGHPQPLSEIAADRGVPVEQVIAAVEQAIAVLRLETAQP